MVCLNLIYENAWLKSRLVDQEQYARHSQFWLEDGNIILVASEIMGFRVHRSVLALKSDFFKDMLILPQPKASSSDTSASHCPVLHLQDSPEDLAYPGRRLPN